MNTAANVDKSSCPENECIYALLAPMYDFCKIKSPTSKNA